MSHRLLTLGAALLLSQLLLLALHAVPAQATPANTFTRQREVVDVQRVAGCWNQTPGMAACPSLLDVDGEPSITTADIAAVAGHWEWVG